MKFIKKCLPCKKCKRKPEIIKGPLREDKLTRYYAIRCTQCENEALGIVTSPYFSKGLHEKDLLQVIRGWNNLQTEKGE